MSNTDRIIEEYRKREKENFERWKAAGCPARWVVQRVDLGAIVRKPKPQRKQLRKQLAPKPTPKTAPVPPPNGQTVVLQHDGISRLPDGTPKRALLEHLKALGGRASVQDLSSKMGLPLAPFSKSIKPLLSSLSKAKWIAMQ